MDTEQLNIPLTVHLKMGHIDDIFMEYFQAIYPKMEICRVDHKMNSVGVLVGIDIKLVPKQGA